MRATQHLRCLMAAALLLAASAQATVPVASTTPPTTAEVEFNTRFLVKARLRLPESLQGFTVTRIAPLAGEATRFEVEVQFRASTPFGAVTQHRARFLMKRASQSGEWIVTAE